jgi:hypothetical protein
MPNTSREQILADIRSNLPAQRVEHPRIPRFTRPDIHLKSAFQEHLENAGGAWHEVMNSAEAIAKKEPNMTRLPITMDRVREIFKGLEKGDGASFFNHVDDDVDWTVNQSSTGWVVRVSRLVPSRSAIVVYTARHVSMARKSREWRFLGYESVCQCETSLEHLMLGSRPAAPALMLFHAASGSSRVSELNCLDRSAVS